MSTTYNINLTFFSQGVKVICGVDEAGRGPLAGPVCAAAVILPEHLELPGLTDSKKLTDKKRRELFPFIREQAIAYGIGFASEQEIDEINILQATFLAMQRALDQLSVGRTTVVIAHRLSTIRGAEKIIVIDEGGVTEQGSHNELMELDGTYARYFNMQFEGLDIQVDK